MSDVRIKSPFSDSVSYRKFLEIFRKFSREKSWEGRKNKRIDRGRIVG